jgi:hypothetical protein
MPTRKAKTDDDALRWEHYHTIPPKHWQKLFGGQHKVFYDMADRYDLPAMKGDPIDLEAFAHQVHALLKKHGSAIVDSAEDSELDNALKREKIAGLRQRRLTAEKELVNGAKMMADLGMAMRLVRGAGTILRQQFGAAAEKILSDALDAAARQIAKKAK